MKLLRENLNDFLNEKQFSEKSREKLASKGHALPDGSYPIESVQDLKNAIHAIGRAKDPAKAKAHIKKRAKALGKTDLIPEKWCNESLNEGYDSNEKRKLDRISNLLNYDDFNEFLGDNPGCYDAITSWIEGIADFSRQLSSENNDTLEELGLYRIAENKEDQNLDESLDFNLKTHNDFAKRLAMLTLKTRNSMDKESIADCLRLFSRILRENNEDEAFRKIVSYI